MKKTFVTALAGAVLGVIPCSASDPAAPTTPPAAPPQQAASTAYFSQPALQPLNRALPSWLSLSGEFRFRFESRQGLGFREGNDDGYGLVRTRVDIGIKPKPWLEFFFQGQDSRAPEMREGTATGVFRDPFDVRQAYVKLGGGEHLPATVTAGRQILLYGDQRLIGPLDWTNTSRVFDAVKLEYQPLKDVKLDFFSASVVANDPRRRVNISPEGNNLHGFYGGIKNVLPKSAIEPFLLWKTTPLVNNELGIRGDLDRYTGGVRIWGKDLGRWDYNLAVAKQWGDAAGADISAWGSYFELGYTFPVVLTPRAYAEYTFGSGDSDPADGRIGGFDDLFPTAHLWYGYNDLVGWRNLKNIRLGTQISPHKKLKISFDYHGFWLASRNDGLYNVAGVRTVAAPAGGAADAKIGDEADITFTVPLSPTITFGGGVGHMFPGPFLKANTPGGSNTFTFLFAGYKF